MVNADKNVDRHAVNQIWTKSPGRLLMYLLVKGSGPNIFYTFSLFFFFFFLFCFVLFLFFFCFVFVFFLFFEKKKSTRHAYQWSRQNEDFNRDLEFWTCFPEV